MRSWGRRLVMARRPWRDYRREYEKRTKPLGVRVDPETRREVEDCARSEGTTIANLLRDFIEWGLEATRDSKPPTTLQSPSQRSGVYNSGRTHVLQPRQRG